MTLTELAHHIWDAIDRTFSASHDRVSPAYMGGALAIAALIWWRTRDGRDANTSLVRFLFPREVWWHPSAQLDYRLLLARSLLNLVLLGSLAVSVTKVSFAVARALWKHVGILPSFDLPPVLIVAAFSVGAFIVEDFARFWLHVAAHRIPAFWELHKVHHSAEVLTPFTIYRVHPIEGVINATGAALAIGVLGGVLNWCFPGKLAAWTISGTYALTYLWNILGTNLRHSHVWLSYGPQLEHFLISPAQHQLHHSVDPQHRDRNFGSAIAVWDWLFGTLLLAGPRQRLVFGLAPEERNHDSSVLSAWWNPLRHAFRRR